MESLYVLVMMSIAMLVGSFLVGNIPISFKMSEARLLLTTALGAGLLVGTALIVIIPEGVHTFYGIGLTHTHDDGEHNEVPMHEEKISAFTSCNTDNGGMLGATLAMGFVFMMLIDQFSATHSHRPSTAGDQESGVVQSQHQKFSTTTTLGLIVHAAADGIALGAAVAADNSSVEMIVFFTIMLHKAPAAFGLTSFLMHEGLDNTRIRRHLAVFSVAAPISSILTYIGLVYSMADLHGVKTHQVTGAALLFSAGTFLYVATVHVMPELKHLGGSKNGDGHLTLTQILVVLCGILIPAILSSGHHH